jgi:hypothetical protein
MKMEAVFSPVPTRAHGVTNQKTDIDVSALTAFQDVLLPG